MRRIFLNAMKFSRNCGPRRSAAEKKFYQGLIQAAVALFHFGNENLGGARKLYQASREKLRPVSAVFSGTRRG